MLGGISIWQLVIVLIIVVLLFGTKKLKNLGSDLGAAIKGFKDEYKGDEQSSKDKTDDLAQNQQTKIEEKQNDTTTNTTAPAEKQKVD